MHKAACVQTRVLSLVPYRLRPCAFRRASGRGGTSAGDPITGMGWFRLGASYSEEKALLNGKGISVVVSPEQSPLKLREKPAGAYLGPSSESTGGAEITLVKIAIDPNAPVDAQMVLLGFDKGARLQQIVLALFETKGFDPGEYATDVLVPLLDRKYRRGPARKESRDSAILTWNDDAGNEIAVLGFSLKPRTTMVAYATPAFSIFSGKRKSPF